MYIVYYLHYTIFLYAQCTLTHMHACTRATCAHTRNAHMHNALNIDSSLLRIYIQTCTHHVVQGSASCCLVSPSIITCPPSNTHRAGRGVGRTHLGQHSPWGVIRSSPNWQTVSGQVVCRQRRTPWSQKLEECTYIYSANVRNSTTRIHAKN